MMIIVQRVVTSWTKQSRGGAAAARRNAVPEAFSLPAAGPGAVWVHEVDAREHDDFTPVEAVRTLTRLSDVDGVPDPEAGRSSFPLETDVHLAVAGVNDKTRAAMRVCAAVAPVTSGVFLLEADDRLRVVVSPPLARSPRYGPREVFVLAPGERARWRFNGRFTPQACTCHMHEWWYEKWVVNVAYRAGSAPDLFTSQRPDHVVDHLVRLF
jgi:hypothetical protein